MTVTVVRSPVRPLGHDPIEPPPDEAHGPGRCLGCAQLITMHSSGLCSRCGSWLVAVDAAEVRSGDLVLYGTFWAPVHGTSLDVDGVVEIAFGIDIPAVTIGPEGTVWIAANHRRTH